MRTRIFQIVQIAQKGDRASRLYDMFIVIVAFASIIPLMFHIEKLPHLGQLAITMLDLASVYILFFDYLLRWMTHDIKLGQRGSWKAIAKYPFTISAIIDLAGILPSLGVLPENFLFLRALRVFRVMRYSRQLTVVANVFASEKRRLTSVLMLVCLYIFIVALIMFCNEPNTFDSFIDALYWSAVTLTTIGYGDIHPVSDLGKIIVIASSIFGILVIALPAGIITGSFLDQLHRMEENRERYFEISDTTRLLKDDLKAPTLANLKAYLRSQPRVATYAAYMAAFTALDCALYGIMSMAGFPVWLDTVGTALAAFTLEPAAGLIVGFAHSLVLAIVNGNAGNLLYYAECVAVVMVYAFLVPKWRTSGRGGTAVRAIATIAAAQAAISFILAGGLSSGVIITPFEALYLNAIGAAGIPGAVAELIAILIDRVLDATAVYMLVSLIYAALRRKNLEPSNVIRRKKEALEAEKDSK